MVSGTKEAKIRFVLKFVKRVQLRDELHKVQGIDIDCEGEP